MWVTVRHTDGLCSHAPTRLLKVLRSYACRDKGSYLAVIEVVAAIKVVDGGKAVSERLVGAKFNP